MFLERKDIIFLTFSLRVGKDDKKIDISACDFSCRLAVVVVGLGVC